MPFLASFLEQKRILSLSEVGYIHMIFILLLSVLLTLELFCNQRILWLVQAGLESKIDKSAKIIVACSAGGTMKPSQNLPEGQQSRFFSAFHATYNLWP